MLPICHAELDVIRYGIAQRTAAPDQPRGDIVDRCRHTSCILGWIPAGARNPLMDREHLAGGHPRHPDRGKFVRLQ